MRPSDVFEHIVQCLILRIIHDDAVEVAVMERRPCLQGDVMKTGMIKQAPITVCSTLERRIGLHAAVDHMRCTGAELDLVRDEFMVRVLLDEVELSGMEVAEAEMPHFTALMQIIESFRNFPRFHQCIRPVEHEYIQIIRTETLEDAVDGIQYM